MNAVHGDPPAPAGIPDPDPDSQGCLFVVASYTDLASGLARVTAEVGQRLMMSPVLGDFIELRFVDVGPRPSRAGENVNAVRVLAGELTRPGEMAGRSYFGLVVADRSAAAVASLLRECGSDPVISALPLRTRGLASIDDLSPADGSATAADQGTNVIVSSEGSWGYGDLAGELRQYAEKLLQDFATGHEPGFTATDLALLRSQHLTEPAADEAVQQALAAGSEADDVRPVTVDLLSPPGRPAQDVPSDQRCRDHRVTTLVFLVLVGRGSLATARSWWRGRCVLLDVDKKIAAETGAHIMVRAFVSTEDPAGSELRAAGLLRRRDVKSRTTRVSFARTLNLTHDLLKQDILSLESAQARVMLPEVVFYAAELPPADVVTLQAHKELARQALITWVVPGRMAGLISPSFADGDARIMSDHRSVADDVACAWRAESLCAIPTQIRW